MSCHQLNLIIIFMWELIYFSGIVSEKICTLNSLFQCSTEETCEQVNNSTSGVCKCRREYQLDSDGRCIPSHNSNVPDSDDPVLPTPEGVYSHGTSASAITVGLLVPIFFISILGALIFAAKKYRWLHRVREHAHQLRARHYDTVLVNQEDDPPCKMKMLLALTLGVFTTFSTIMYITTIADFCRKASDKLCFDVDKNSIFTSENNRYYLYEVENRSSELLGNVSHVLFRLDANSTDPFHRINSTTRSTVGASPPNEFFQLTPNSTGNSTKFDLIKDNNLKYLRRRDNLQRVCRGYYNSSQILKVKRIKLDHILIDEKNKVLFCYVPKVACTNWKRIFMVLTGKADNISQVINLPSYEIHAKNLFTSLQNYSSAQADYIINNYSKFIFVRNPFERLLSAYRNKLEQHYDSSKYFQARFGKYIIKNFRKNPSNVSLEKGDDVTFAEFAKYLTSSEVSSYNEHWQTVTELCHPCYLNYDLVGKYETLTEDSDFVLNYFKLNFSFPGLPKPSRTASSLVKYFSTLDKDVIYKLYKIYELDFKLFGYDLFETLGWSGG